MCIRDRHYPDYDGFFIFIILMIVILTISIVNKNMEKLNKNIESLNKNRQDCLLYTSGVCNVTKRSIKGNHLFSKLA